MGYVKEKVAREVADRMTERYGIDHVAVYNNRTAMFIVITRKDLNRVTNNGTIAVNVIYP